LSRLPSSRQRAVRHIEIAEDAGSRIDNYLLRELKGVPRSRVYRMLRSGEVRVNGARVAAQYRLRDGDRVRIPPWHGPTADARVMPSAATIDWLAASVLYEDRDVIVLDKPAGIAVHGGSGIAFGVVEALRRRGGAQFVELAHRLDRDTSGVLVLARRRAVLKALHAAFREGRVEKRYEVLVHGRWPRRTRSVQAPLKRVTGGGGERRVRVDTVQGKLARTEFEVIESVAQASWVNAFPHTGRTHQIRVHCAIVGHPIVGDVKYAGDARIATARQLGIRRLCLHAAEIAIPLDGSMRRFVAPTPDALRAAWRALADPPSSAQHGDALGSEKVDQSNEG